MSWTVACFCGTVFEPPPDRCPTCDAHVPGVHSTGRRDGAPRRPGVLSRDLDAEPVGLGSLERELSELIASAPRPDDRSRSRPVDAGAPPSPLIALRPDGRGSWPWRAPPAHER